MRIPYYYVSIGLLIICSFYLNGCAVCCSHKSCGSSVTSFNNYTNYYCNFKSKTGLLIFVCDGSTNITAATINTDQPPVLVLHELPGMTPQCLALGTNLAAHGYTVYMPLLFDKPNESSSWSSFRNLIVLSFDYLDWHFYLFRKHSTPPIVSKLKMVAQQIHQSDQGKPMAIIGMCLTGTLPLAMLSDVNVRFVVLSQPAIPFGITSNQMSALAISPEDLAQATNRVAETGLKVMGLRFASDSICTAQRFKKLQIAFGTNFLDRTIPLEDCRTNFCPKLHSVLCEQYDDNPTNATRERFQEIVTNLDFALKRNF